jgi:hypothetical protein
VLTLDIHKTKYMFHSNVTIADGNALGPKNHGFKEGDWVFRDHLNSKVRSYEKNGIKGGYLTQSIG